MAWNWLSDRNPGYQKIAEKLGLVYQEKDANKEVLNAHKIFKLFSVGGSKKVKYILTGELDSGEPAFIFEYSYVVSTGKSSHTYFQHVLSVRLANNLPPFTLDRKIYFTGSGSGWDLRILILKPTLNFPIITGSNPAMKIRSGNSLMNSCSAF